MTAQEHIELDAFFSEFDMPTRWGLLRLKELDVLNVAGHIICDKIVPIFCPAIEMKVLSIVLFFLLLLL